MTGKRASVDAYLEVKVKSNRGPNKFLVSPFHLGTINARSGVKYLTRSAHDSKSTT